MILLDCKTEAIISSPLEVEHPQDLVLPVTKCAAVVIKFSLPQSHLHLHKAE